MRLLCNVLTGLDIITFLSKHLAFERYDLSRHRRETTIWWFRPGPTQSNLYYNQNHDLYKFLIAIFVTETGKKLEILD